MTRLTGAGLGIEMPDGWEGRIGRASLAPQSSSAAVTEPPSVTHLANFPLPASRSDFGAEVVETMGIGDVFVALFEYGPESVGAALFAAQGVPKVMAKDFDRNALQHRVGGQSGVQRFFTLDGRPFCLYIVIGSHLDRADFVQPINAILASVEASR